MDGKTAGLAESEMRDHRESDHGLKSLIIPAFLGSLFNSYSHDEKSEKAWK
jgi:hypothetical protein